MGADALLLHIALYKFAKIRNLGKFSMAMIRQLLFIWVAIYSQIRLCGMQNILILIIAYYRITTVIIKITDQNIVILE